MVNNPSPGLVILAGGHARVVLPATLVGGMVLLPSVYIDSVMYGRYVWACGASTWVCICIVVCVYVLVP